MGLIGNLFGKSQSSENISNKHFDNDIEKTSEMLDDWEEDNPESMKKLCPKLYSHFWQ